MVFEIEDLRDAHLIAGVGFILLEGSVLARFVREITKGHPRAHAVSVGGEACTTPTKHQVNNKQHRNYASVLGFNEIQPGCQEKVS